MSECDHCGEDYPVTATLNHVHFDTSPVSRMVSRYVVCLPCRKKLKADPEVAW